MERYISAIGQLSYLSSKTFSAYPSRLSLSPAEFAPIFGIRGEEREAEKEPEPRKLCCKEISSLQKWKRYLQDYLSVSCTLAGIQTEPRTSVKVSCHGSLAESPCLVSIVTKHSSREPPILSTI